MKKNKILIKLVALLFLAAGCRNDRKLNGYYDIYWENIKRPIGAYKFYKDGRCFYYMYNRSTGERQIFDVDDVIEDYIWSYNNDTLKIIGCRYEVVRFSSDTLGLKPIGKCRDKMLVKSNRQEDE